VQDQLDKYPSDIFSRVEVADGRAWMLPSGTEFFAGDLSEEDQKLVWATHYAPVYNLFQQQKLSADKIAWRSKPSWYILATKDHTVHPDLQRWVSKRMGATVTEVASSHVPMLSQPDVVIDVIRKAATAVQNNSLAGIAGLAGEAARKAAFLFIHGLLCDGCFWQIASFRCRVEFGHYQSVTDIGRTRADQSRSGGHVQAMRYLACS
jgi:Alpha/beta hydrolase family